MAPRAPLIAGRTVIVVQIQDTIDRSLATISSKLNKFSTRVSRLGFELFAGGLVGSLFTTQVTNQFKEFEDRILFLSTKLKTTQVEFERLTEKIRDLGRTTSFTAIQVADGATILAQAGLNAKEVIDTLQPALDLARGAQIELEAAGAILVNTIRSFSLETTKASEVASQFVAAARLGTLNVIDLKESIKEVLGTVRNLNIDLPTTLALITQMAERSLKGTKAGTSLNTALLNLASKQKQIKDSLGITLPDDIDSGSFINFLDQLYNRINKLGNLRRTAVLQRLFNIRGGRAITALDDIKKIVDLQREIRNAGNEAREAAKKMDSGLGGSIRIAISAVESLSITVGNLVGNAIKPYLDILPAFTAELEKLANANSGLIISLLLTPPALVAVGAALLVAGFAGTKLAGIIGVLAVSIKSLGGLGLKALSGQLIAITSLFSSVRGGASRLDSAVATRFLGPTDPDKIIRNEKRVTKARANLRKAQLGASYSAEVAAQKKLNAALGRLNKARQSSFLGRVGRTGIDGSIGGIAKGIRFLFVQLVELPRLIQRLIGRAGFAKFGTTLRTLATGGLRLLTTGFSKLFAVIRRFDLVKFLFNTFRTIGGIAKGFLLAANAVRRFVFSFSGILTIFELLLIFGPRIEFIRKAFERLGKGISDAFSTISGTFRDLGPAFNLFTTGFKSILAGQGALGVEGIVDSLRLMADIVKSNLVVAFNQLKLAIAPLYDAIRITLSSVIELAKLLGSIFGATFSNIGTGIAGLAGAGGRGIAGGVVESIREAFSKDNIKAAFSFVGSFFIEIAKSINNILKNIFLVVSNTMTGISNAIAATFKIFQSLTAIIQDALPKTLFGSSITGDLATGLGKLSQSVLLPMVKQFTVSAEKNEEASKLISSGFEAFPDKMQVRFDAFLTRLDSIFKVNTAANAQTAIDAANAAKALAQQEAEERARRIGLSTAAGVTPFTQLGQAIHSIPQRIAEGLGRAGGAAAEFLRPTATPQGLFENLIKQGTDFANLLKELTPTINRRAVIQEQIKLEERDQRDQRAQANRRNAFLKQQQADLAKTETTLSGFTPGKILGGILGQVVGGDFGAAGRLAGRLLTDPNALAAGKEFNRLNELKKSGREADALATQERRARIAELKAQLRPGANLPVHTLRDITAATVGSFRQTRGNLLKIAGGQSIEQKQLSVLETIKTNTGGDTESLFDVMSGLSKRAQPFVFQ